MEDKKKENIEKETEKFTIPEIRKYYTETTEKLKEIDDMIKKLELESKDKNDKEKKDGIGEIISKIKLYREQFYNVMEFLPGYDKLQYSKNYDEELEKVNNLKNKLFPKKKFAFSKVNKKEFLYDVKCTKSLSDEIEYLGGKGVIYRTGNSYTKSAVRDLDLPFGGELSGHIYFREKGFFNDNM